MIRKLKPTDIELILTIWLNTSIKAHGFVSPEFWKSQVPSMRDIYIPASETYVYEKNGEIVGFYSLYEDMLAAIFVAPEHQCKGIGKELIAHVKSQRNALTLSVYKANHASYQFYLKQGFITISEQLDEHTGHPECMMKWDRY
ncbi:N-acetyltransferase [Vibrio cholerae]|nr:N-acetyltransferase [Vibrio cholerae]EGR5011793.1 N-acetyltransferase [Vibrio cholerae]EJL6264298.1 N-acetyltransferase [Vibrio cholerae]EJL6441833.1 N-acetyltransferase [Vibrio cholerae]EJL6691920.1 N-acetyltransferase [Vibrio cholerae]